MGSDAQRCIDCGEPPDHPNHQMPIPEELKAQVIREIQRQASPPPKQDWQGDNPFWLMFQPKDQPGRVGIDLDEAGWIEANKEHMRSEGVWYLMAKRNNRPLFSVQTNEGDQFYYAKRHVGIIASSTVETVAYGIGKKQADGKTVNLWLLPNGVICGGDDVDSLSIAMLKEARQFSGLAR